VQQFQELVEKEICLFPLERKQNKDHAAVEPFLTLLD
jgi:hypothetical protein